MFLRVITPATRPETPIMTPVAVTAALTAAQESFLQINGQPTDDDIVCLLNAIAPILLDITYDRVHGLHNLWGLVADSDRYLHHYGLPFDRPATRPAC